ncbi:MULTISPECIES: hypothetical protein [unclassified Streptomyces]|nr:hypothetical protein [Streptomyces sp. DH-12]
MNATLDRFPPRVRAWADAMRAWSEALAGTRGELSIQPLSGRRDGP